MSRTGKAASIAGLLLPSATPLLAVNGGALDGTAHPAVGFIHGTPGSDACSSQVLGCTGVLIAPTVFLTSAERAEDFSNPEQYGYVFQAICVSFDEADPFSRSPGARLGVGLPEEARDREPDALAAAVDEERPSVRRPGQRSRSGLPRVDARDRGAGHHPRARRLLGRGLPEA